MSISMKRSAIVVAAATLASVAVAAPANANDLPLQIKNPSGGLHATLFWDDSIDTLCLTLRSGAAGSYADADMRLVGGGSAQHLRVTPSHTRDCTGNLSIPEDRLAEMVLYGGSNVFHTSTGWQRFYT